MWLLKWPRTHVKPLWKGEAFCLNLCIVGTCVHSFFTTTTIFKKAIVEVLEKQLQTTLLIGKKLLSIFSSPLPILSSLPAHKAPLTQFAHTYNYSNYSWRSKWKNMRLYAWSVKGVGHMWKISLFFSPLFLWLSKCPHLACCLHLPQDLQQEILTILMLPSPLSVFFKSSQLLTFYGFTYCSLYFIWSDK